MNMEVMGKVVSVSKQWWLKINTKPIRMIGTDGAIYPYVIKVSYTVDGVNYYKRKWISAGKSVPQKDSVVKVVYDNEKPSKSKIL